MAEEDRGWAGYWVINYRRANSFLFGVVCGDAKELCFHKSRGF